MAPNDKCILTNDEQFPSWLDEDFFKDILSKQYRDYKIKDFAAKAALQCGENYTSILIRVAIELELAENAIDRVSYIVKIMSEKESKFNLLKEMNLFPKEIEMYTEILPKFEEMFQRCGSTVKFGPNCLKASSTQPSVLVMEDLSMRNFTNSNRLDGLDIEHMKAVIDKLAQFHAASACYIEWVKDFNEIYHEGIFTKKLLQLFEGIHENSTKIYLECVMNWPNGPKYVEKIRKLQAKFFDRIVDALSIDWDSFNVLNHGDLWSNNIMFQHDDAGKIIETYFVDFQLCKLGSPAQDLHYLLISSSSYDTKTKYFDYFIEYYYERLIDNLELLKFPKPPPTLADFQLDIERRGFIGISTALGVMSAVVLDPSDDATMDNYLSNDEEGNSFKRHTYGNPRYVREMEALLPFFDKRGFLD